MGPTLLQDGVRLTLTAILSAGTKSGYKFAWTSDGNTPSVGYSITATPVSVGSTGQRMFFSDQSGVIRYAASGSGATAASPALQFSSTYPNAGYPATLAALGGANPCTATSTNGCLLDAIRERYVKRRCYGLGGTGISRAAHRAI